MKTKRDILAACDLSQFSLPVLRLATELAADTGRQLIVAHVIHHRNIDSVTYAMSMEGLFNEAAAPEDFVKKFTQERASELQGLINRAGANRYLSKIEITVGNPFESLMGIIEKKAPYMAVIGTKGRGAIAGILAGSVAAKLLGCCPVPLVCVPPGLQAAPENAQPEDTGIAVD